MPCLDRLLIDVHEQIPCNVYIYILSPVTMAMGFGAAETAVRPMDRARRDKAKGVIMMKSSRCYVLSSSSRSCTLDS